MRETIEEIYAKLGVQAEDLYQLAADGSAESGLDAVPLATAQQIARELALAVWEEASANACYGHDMEDVDILRDRIQSLGQRPAPPGRGAEGVRRQIGLVVRLGVALRPGLEHVVPDRQGQGSYQGHEHEGNE